MKTKKSKNRKTKQSNKKKEVFLSWNHPKLKGYGHKLIGHSGKK